MKMVDKMIAYCGLVCTDCEGYLATQNNDSKKRQEVAEKWTKMMGMNFTADGIICDGCLTTKGRISHFCTTCPVRKCGQEKGVISCAYCDDYICETLGVFFKNVPQCKDVLDSIRKGLS
jgi:hypothetical protein